MTWEDDFRQVPEGSGCQEACSGVWRSERGTSGDRYQESETNRRNAGFTDEEREKMTELLNDGFTDTFRYLHPEEVTYSWWSYRYKAREKNAGWRIDYFLVSDRLKEQITEAKIHTDIMGSDHCPVEVDLAL